MTDALPTDACTAFRLTMESDGTAPVGRMLACWNMIDTQAGVKRELADLPEMFTRQERRIVSSIAMEPLTLTTEDVINEAFRLSGLHAKPDASGWHRLSNIARVATILTRDLSIREPVEGGRRYYGKGVSARLRAHPLLETTPNRYNDLLIRPRGGDGGKGLAPVRTLVLCPGDMEARDLGVSGSFGEAYRKLLGMPKALVADGTVATFDNQDETKTAAFDAAGMRWMAETGRRLSRIDPSDPVMHTYRHGHMVESVIGFVSKSRTGRLFANVGIPHDSEGDLDAHIEVLDRKEVASVDDGMELIRSRDDVDHVFRGVQWFNGQMGFWLTCFENPEETTA